MWLKTQAHHSDNSIGIRFRPLRALYNQAISDNLIKKPIICSIHLRSVGSRKQSLNELSLKKILCAK